MGDLLSRSKQQDSDLDELCKDSDSLLSVSLSKFISNLMMRPPRKLRFIELYHTIYNKVFGPWGRIVGSYADCMSVWTSDVDFMLDAREVFTFSSFNMSRNSSLSNNDSSVLQENNLEELFETASSKLSTPRKEQVSPQHGLQLGTQNLTNDVWKKEFLIFTEHEEIPAGCCRLVAYDTDGIQTVPSKSDKLKISGFDDIFKKSQELEFTLVDRDGFKCLSSREWLECKRKLGLTLYPWINRLLPKWHPHGPAFHQAYFGLLEIDVIECFHCKSLPDVLRQWVKRKRKQWPSSQTIKTALSQGCHVVSLPSKISTDDLNDLEWRFGYGPMEKVLMDSLNDVQKHCFILLKIILEEYIQPTFPDEDILSSFIIKMLIFWVAEETWVPSNLLYCLNICMERLNEWVQWENCLNFFIPEYNLFRTKTKRIRKVKLAAWFQKCVELEWRILLKCKTTKLIIQQHLQKIKME